jgi:hypothetical protein
VGMAPILGQSRVGADYVGFKPLKRGPSVWDGTLKV